MKRQERVEIFRQRVIEIIGNKNLTRSAFASSIGIDRSTLSQLLSGDMDRLPRADTVASIAETYQVSIDWLLGITQQGNLGADIVPEPLTIEELTGSSAYQRLEEWHKEASGYRIRYVPSTLPDLMKTEDVIRYEFEGHGQIKSEYNIEVSEDRLAYQRQPETEMEICQSHQSVRGFARGEGIWRGLAKNARLGQLDRMIELADELYPSLRWFLFDGLSAYSVPITVFGPKRAVVFMGKFYLSLNSTEHIRELSRRFDNLIRAANIQPTEIINYLSGLRKEC